MAKSETLFWIRSFRSKREAEDMKKILIKFGRGNKKDVLCFEGLDGLYDLKCYADHTTMTYIKGFVRGWIACTNTRSVRPKIK